MTDHEQPDPWADVSLPPPFDAREIYEYATSVGAQRRGQRRRRQVVLTISGLLVVALTATGISLTGGDGGETSIQVATQASIPRAPARSKQTVPAPRRRGQASAPRKSAAPPAPPNTPQCNALAGVMSSSAATLTAFHSVRPLDNPHDTTTTEPVPETTTTTPPPPETTTTTTTTTPPPPVTTPTTRRTTPPTRIDVSPETALPPAAPGDAPVSPAPSPLVRRRTRC